MRVSDRRDSVSKERRSPSQIPIHGLGWKGRGVVRKTVHETARAQDAKPRCCLRRGAASRSAQQKNADDPKSKESHALDALLPSKTALEQERRRRDSNPGWRICNPLPCPLNPEENGPLEKRLAPETGNGAVTAELASVIGTWHSLPPDTHTAIPAIVEAAHVR